MVSIAATTNQRRLSLPMMWKFQTKLRSIEALALISALELFSVTNDNSPLLGYISPSASDVSRLIYVNHVMNVYHSDTKYFINSGPYIEIIVE